MCIRDSVVPQDDGGGPAGKEVLTTHPDNGRSGGCPRARPGKGFRQGRRAILSGRGLQVAWRGRRPTGRLLTHVWAWIAALAAACLLSVFAVAPTDALPEVLSLKLFNIHTQAQGTFVFKRNGVYD